jgi:transcriptional regulator with XRE-family HTH domain
MEEGLSNLLLKTLGRRIRELRTEQGYSQEAFADKCGVHRTFMGTIERGESNLSFQNILKVARTLGVTLSNLFLDLEKLAQGLPRTTDADKLKKRARESKGLSKVKANYS